MPPPLATIVFTFGIAALFVLNRDREARTSSALWLPVIWLALNGSRGVSQWLGEFGFRFGAQLTPEQYLEGSPVDRNVYLALTVLAVLVLIHRHQRIGSLLLINGPILLFIFYCALSTLWSDHTDVAFKRWIKAVGDISMVLVVLTDTDPLAAIKRWLSRVGFLLLPLSVLFIKYYPNLGRGYSPIGGVDNHGVAGSKNFLGMTTLIFALGSEWAFLEAFQKRKTTRVRGPLIAHGLILAIAAWLFWAANSATSLACFLLTGTFIAVIHLTKSEHKPRTVHLLTAATLSISLIALFFDSGGNLVGTLGRDATLTGRTDIWKLVLGMSGNPLFGVGFESFWLGERLEKTWNLYHFHLNESHNGYIEIYLTLGWIGIALLAILLVTGYRNLLSAFRQDPGASSLKLGYFIVAVIYNLAESAFRGLNPIWIFFFFAITAIPKPSTSEVSRRIGIHHHDDLAKSKPQTDRVHVAQFRKETT
jgi:exopolysaccharide production protein ExoQ